MLSLDISDIVTRLSSALQSETRQPKRDILALQQNALTSVVATIQLWSQGMLLQEGILLRNALEVIATAAWLNADKDACAAFRGDRFDSAKAITKAKHLFLPLGSTIGSAYGFLSQDFTHITKELYASWQMIPLDFNEQHLLSLKTMLTPIKYVMLALDQLSELTCYDVCASHHYWVRESPGHFRYKTNPKTKKKMQKFLGPKGN